MQVPAEVVTPRVVVDADVLDRNVERMAAGVRARGARLRPHAKTHKMLEVADRQRAAGAHGLTVATVGEAEVFAAHGVADLFIAYPLWVDAARAERLRRLGEQARIVVGVDSAEAAAVLGRALPGLGVLVEVDSGQHRSGVPPAAAGEVVRAADRAGLRVEGVFTFPGHSYAPGMPAQAAAEEAAALRSAAYAVGEAGYDVGCLSGGATPTALLAEEPVATELRPGVYVFGDAQQWELGACAPEDIALTVAATVVSRDAGRAAAPRRVVLDAGSKVLGADRPAWASGHGRLVDHPDARVTGLSEHHAVVAWPRDGALPALGARLRVVPNHVCAAVNLVDDVAVVRAGGVVDQWRVAARGRNA